MFEPVDEGDEVELFRQVEQLLRRFVVREVRHLDLQWPRRLVANGFPAVLKLVEHGDDGVIGEPEAVHRLPWLNLPLHLRRQHYLLDVLLLLGHEYLGLYKRAKKTGVIRAAHKQSGPGAGPRCSQ